MNAGKEMIDIDKAPKCRDCVNYDTSRFPEEFGKLAICMESKSGMHKVGHYSLGCEFFEERKSRSGGSV